MSGPTNLPFVSVIMPVRNEAGFIERSLSAVLVQDYPADLTEVIVADGMSSDNTRKVVVALQARHPNLRLIDNPGRIVPHGLNAAIAAAAGSIIIRVDGHCEIAPDYVRRCVEHILIDGVEAVGGSIQTIGETPMARVIALGMSSVFGVGNSAARTRVGETMFVDSVPFPAYTRSVLERAGPFDTELVRNQDDEYNYRLRKLGVKILLAADVRSRYYSRSSLRSLWRQYYQYGFWKVRVMQKHTAQMSARQFAPPVFVLALLLTSSLALFSQLARMALAFVAGSYALVNLMASAAVARKAEWPYLLLLPVIFATLHVSYGLGFLNGLVKFRDRWLEVR